MFGLWRDTYKWVAYVSPIFWVSLTATFGKFRDQIRSNCSFCGCFSPFRKDARYDGIQTLDFIIGLN